MDLFQAVITTKYVIKHKSKVILVYHSSDGWQFFGSEKNITEADSMVVSLKTIISLNPHIEEILWIGEGMEAWVNNDNVWKTGLCKYD